MSPPARKKTPPTVLLHGSALRRQRFTFALLVLVIPPAGTVAAVALWPVLRPSRLDAILFGLFYLFALLGIEVGFHRLFSHGAFKTSRTLRALFAVAGCMALQGPLMYWVAHHRRHHQRTDAEGDPHSPLLHDGTLRGRARALIHAHVGWIFGAQRASPAVYARDIVNDRALLFIDRHYYTWMFLTFALPGAIAFAITGRLQAALTATLWAGLVRIFVTQQATYAVNSLAHLVGARPFKTKDGSRNIALLAPLSAGGFLHNTHHAFPTTAKNSVRWHEVDTGWGIIRLLEGLGLAWDVRRPSKKVLAAKRNEAAQA